MRGLLLVSVKGKVRALSNGNALVELVNRRRGRRRQPKLLLRRPVVSRAGGHAPRRINALLAGLPGASRYLEIGVFTGRTLQMIQARHRVGVDPSPAFDTRHLPRGVEFHTMTSDDYFASVGPSTRFDLAFVDGLHTYEQTYRDVIHSLGHLDDGVLVIDDTVPDDEISANPDQLEAAALRGKRSTEGLRWHGDVWKVVAAIDRLHAELALATITTGENAQTLVWRTTADRRLSEPSSEALAAIGALSYAEVLGSGLPEWFHPCGEDEAIATALAAVATRR